MVPLSRTPAAGATGSRRVAERAGYTLEATLHQDDVAPDGELRDRLIFVKLR